jgi:hypothetical protein
MPDTPTLVLVGSIVLFVDLIIDVGLNVRAK